jgi:hypothetical protein
VRLIRSRKYFVTGAAVLGAMLGAAGIAAATTGSSGVSHRSPAIHAQQTAEANDTAEGNDAAEVNDTPDAQEKADHNDKADGAEREDAGTDAGENDKQG